MYKCNDCGEYFDEPDTHTEYLSEAWGQPIYESYDYCPCCGSDRIEYSESGFDEED